MKFLLTSLAVLVVSYCYSQTGVVAGSVATGPGEVLKVSAGIRLPKDSVVRDRLLGSLRGWLGQKDRSEFVEVGDRPGLTPLMNEMDRLGGFTCYLTNVVALEGDQFRIQFAYMGQRDTVPELRACCTVMAKQKDGKFFFFSPLKEYTGDWKTRTIGNCVFHYKKEINKKKAAEYQKRVAFYDSKLTGSPQAIDFYCCGGFAEASRLVGLDYKLDYNSWAYSAYSGFAADRTVVVCGEKWVDGFSDWDPHDTWHDRLSQILHSPTINRPVDEACAYLYGGSWRVYSPEEILRRFREYAASHPDADWVALYKDGVDFVPGPKILKISYAINALIVERLENEKGFSAVLELLNCGKKEKGDANYFAVIKRLTGVDEPQYNQFVWKLIRAGTHQSVASGRG
jgi:hypothetical protein